MKAKIEYNSGLILIISKNGHTPLLFLEWVSKFRAGSNIIHKILNDRENILRIRLNALREDYESAKEYINNNLPVESKKNKRTSKIKGQ